MDNADEPEVSWSSSNNAVATVVGGVVTAKSLGTAVITAKAGGKEASCSVKVVGAGAILEDLSKEDNLFDDESF